MRARCWCTASRTSRTTTQASCWQAPKCPNLYKQATPLADGLLVWHLSIAGPGACLTHGGQSAPSISAPPTTETGMAVLELHSFYLKGGRMTVETEQVRRCVNLHSQHGDTAWVTRILSTQLAGPALQLAAVHGRAAAACRPCSLQAALRSVVTRMGHTAAPNFPSFADGRGPGALPRMRCQPQRPHTLQLLSTRCCGSASAPNGFRGCGPRAVDVAG